MGTVQRKEDLFKKMLVIHLILNKNWMLITCYKAQQLLFRLWAKLRIYITCKVLFALYDTTQKIKFSINDFFSKCDQICSFLRIWSHLLKKYIIGNFIFLCSVNLTYPKISSLNKNLFGVTVANMFLYGKRFFFSI